MIKESHRNTINRLLQYKPNVDRINYLQKELGMMGVKTTSVISDMPHGSGVSDACGDLAARVGDRKTELAGLLVDVELIDYAVSLLSQPKQLIIKVRFLTDGGQDKGARITLRSNAKKFKWRMLSQSTYERLRDEAIEEMARILGEDKVIS